MRYSTVFLVLMIAVGCESTLPHPHPDSLSRFSKSLRADQPDDAFAAVYGKDPSRLVWIGAKHANHTDSLTFKFVHEAYDAFDFDLVVVEGCPTSWGRNPERLIAYAKEGAAKEKDGFQERGEIVPTVLGALAQSANLLCGEPDDNEIKVRLLALGFNAEDLLGFYVLRSIPQWIRERRINDAADPRIDNLLGDELERNRQRLQLDQSILPSIERWRAWYRNTNGKPLSANFSTEEAGPLIDGPFESNKVGAAISLARAEFLHDLVIKELRERQNVFVVFGASHLMIHQPALSAAIGEPCLVGLTQKYRSFHDC